jgi:hypothetical protein
MLILGELEENSRQLINQMNLLLFLLILLLLLLLVCLDRI